MEDSNLHDDRSSFTTPEMEAALHLIQLSGESDADVDVHGNRFSNSNSYGDVLVLPMSMKRRRNELVCDHDESQGSTSTTTSDMTSGLRRIVVPEFVAEDDDENDNDNDLILCHDVPRFVAEDDDEDDRDVAGSKRGKRKRKKFRSIVEIYQISR